MAEKRRNRFRIWMWVFAILLLVAMSLAGVYRYGTREYQASVHRSYLEQVSFGLKIHFEDHGVWPESYADLHELLGTDHFKHLVALGPPEKRFGSNTPVIVWCKPYKDFFGRDWFYYTDTNWNVEKVRINSKEAAQLAATFPPYEIRD